jgi:hypothetical protein
LRASEKGQEGRHRERECRGERQDLPGDLLPDPPGVVAALDREVAPEQLDHGQVGGGLAVGDRGSLHDEPAVHAVGVGELPEETRLAHARLPDHGDHLAVSQARPVEGLAKLLQLRIPADEAREPPPRRCFQTGAGGACPHQLEHLDRRAEALDRHRAERCDVDKAFDQLQRRRRQEDGARACQLLHPGREMRGLADGRVAHVEIAADGVHDDLARVEPDPDLHDHAVSAASFLRVSLHLLLHPQRGIAGPHRVILVRQRRPKEPHDPVTHHLVHRALVAVDGVHHVLDDRVEQLPGFLRVTFGEQLHRALEVGEEDGDLLALTFERALGGQDLLGEVLRGVGLRRREPCQLGPVAAGRLPAFKAELGTGRQLSAALSAGDGEPRTALQTELRAGGVLMLTPGTPHPRPPAARNGYWDGSATLGMVAESARAMHSPSEALTVVSSPVGRRPPRTGSSLTIAPSSPRSTTPTWKHGPGSDLLALDLHHRVGAVAGEGRTIYATQGGH